MHDAAIVSTPIIPLAERSLAGIARRAACKFGSASFLRSGDHTLSFEAFDCRVNEIAGGLARLGVTKGDRVGLMMRNSIAFVECVFACAKD